MKAKKKTRPAIEPAEAPATDQPAQRVQLVRSIEGYRLGQRITRKAAMKAGIDMSNTRQHHEDTADVEVTRTIGRYSYGQVLTQAEANASGLDKGCFRPFPGVPTQDRAIHAQDVTTR